MTEIEEDSPLDVIRSYLDPTSRIELDLQVSSIVQEIVYRSLDDKNQFYAQGEECMMAIICRDNRISERFTRNFGRQGYQEEAMQGIRAGLEDRLYLLNIALYHIHNNNMSDQNGTVKLSLIALLDSLSERYHYTNYLIQCCMSQWNLLYSLVCELEMMLSEPYRRPKTIVIENLSLIASLKYEIINFMSEHQSLLEKIKSKNIPSANKPLLVRHCMEQQIIAIDIALQCVKTIPVIILPNITVHQKKLEYMSATILRSRDFFYKK